MIVEQRISGTTNLTPTMCSKTSSFKNKAQMESDSKSMDDDSKQCFFSEILRSGGVQYMWLPQCVRTFTRTTPFAGICSASTDKEPTIINIKHVKRDIINMTNYFCQFNNYIFKLIKLVQINKGYY